MDSERHTEPDYPQPVAGEEMQVDAAPVSERQNASDEVEMLPPDDSLPSSSHNIDSGESAATPLGLPVSQIPSPDSTLLSQPPVRRTSTRRSRVDDDHDDERDRRHPSERIGSPSHSFNISNPFPSPSRSTPVPISIFPGPSGLNSRPYRFFQHMTPHNHSNDTSASPIPLNAPQRANTDVEAIPVAEPAGNNTTPAANPTPPGSAGTPQHTHQPGNLRHQYLGGFAITIDVNGNATTTPLPDAFNPNQAPDGADGPPPGLDNDPQQTPGAQQQPQQHPPQPQPDGTSFTGGGAGGFADLLTRIGLLAALSFQNSALFEREVDDPERAKKLVEGLEDVPAGLVKRLERVGKYGNDDGGLGDGGCAICWERLLTDEEAKEEEAVEEQLEYKEGENSSMEATSAEALPTSEDALPPSSSFTSLPSDSSLSSTSGTGAESNQNSTEKKQQRIVSLPCAHVFHATCLLPWFSRPKQTTCPICRFNIDPENLTYTPGAQRRATPGQAQNREETRGETNEAEEQDQGPIGTGISIGGGFPAAGIDVPLIFGGTLPSIISGRGSERNGPQPARGAPTQPTDSANPDNTTTGSNNDNGTENNTNNTGGARRGTSEIVTIGFDMYIGRGPPPLPFRGPGVIQIPLSGPPSAANPTLPAGTPLTGNPTPSTSVPAAATNQSTDSTTTSNTSTGTTTADANAPAGAPSEQGNEPQENSNANGGRGDGPAAGAPFAIPVPMNHGLGRALGDLFSRILGSPAPAPGNTGPNTAPVPGSGTDTGAGAGQSRPQGPVMFGPERPPAGPMPTLANVGFGFAFGGGRGQGLSSFVPTFGAPGGSSASNVGAGVNTGARDQPQEQPGQGQAHPQGGQGAQEGQPQPVFESIPFFDIISGMFGSPAPARGPTAPQGGGQPQQPQPQPTPTQPQEPQEQYHQPGGLGFTWVPGSPPPYPSSHPQHQTQQPPKSWAPPPAPGLTLRERVEKKEKEAGLRCCDISCGVGPSDDDPWVDVPAEGMKQLSIQDPTSLPGPDGKELGQNKTRQALCSHTFHSGCLVSAERVSLALRGVEVSFVGPEGSKEVEVSCPVCRGTGRVSKEEWDAGVHSLN